MLGLRGVMGAVVAAAAVVVAVVVASRRSARESTRAIGRHCAGR